MNGDDARADDAGEAAPCVVPGCGAEGARSIARTEIRKVFPDVEEQGRRGPLCREHYRAWKKATRDARKLDRLTW
ncbi:MAG: hypothetical protein L3K23_04390 [Thermoplasmata archaeon]|nr:hypothetical protein [Thermoplasmata archaeon]